MPEVAEKRVSVRLGIVGGQEVEATFENLGTKGAADLKKLGDAAARSGAQISRSTGAMRAQFQNVGYQVQDFAVQVAGGTSATRALAQQLPQLLSGFGLWGVLLGTATAVLVPLIGYLWGTKDAGEGASEAVGKLAQDVSDLKRMNEVYSTKGIEQLIEKYGQLDAKVLTLIERQRHFKEQQAFDAAKVAARSFNSELETLRGNLEAYDNFTRAAIDRPEMAPDAQSWKEAVEEMGLSVDEARALLAAMEDLRAADTIPEMADATARLTGLIQDTTFAGTEFEGSLLDAEDALRQLNHEGDGIGGWLGAAAVWAKGLADQLWSGAAGAAAIHNASIKRTSPLAQQYAAYGAGQVALRSAIVNDRPLYGGNNNGLTSDQEVAIHPPKLGGSGGSGVSSATNDLEQMAAKIFDATRTEAEKYTAELAKLEAVKKAGLVSDDTYNRQLKALQGTYHQNENAVSAMTSKLEEFVKKTQDLGTGIGDTLVSAFEAGSDAVGEFVRTGKADIRGLVVDMIANFAKLSAQKYIFGPLAGVLSGALGGSAMVAAAIHHEGGMAGGGRGRAVPAALFNGARRMHGGGVAGLAPDEIPAILRRGERVLNQQETRGYGQSGPTVIFNVKDAESVRRSRSQLAADAARVLAMGRRGS